MVCDRCKKEYSDTVFPFHLKICKDELKEIVKEVPKDEKKETPKGKRK